MSNITKLKDMFEKMVISKNAERIPHFYHEDFKLFANEQVIAYQEYLDMHIDIYKTDIQYSIEYDEETFIENGDKIAARMWITIQMPEQAAKRIEVILIVKFQDSKIHRIWELTYPDWSKMPEFENK